MSTRFIEKRLSPQVAIELREVAAQGARRIGRVMDEPAEVVRAIMEYVDETRPLVGNRLVEEARQLGTLWAEQALRVTAWECVELQAVRVSMGYAIVSRDRALALFPTTYLHGLLADAERDNTALLLFNMIRHGNLPVAEPGDYKVIS